MKSSILLLLVLIVNTVNAQVQNSAWTIEPLKDLGFTENLNRYDDVMQEKVQVFAEYGNHRIFFQRMPSLLARPKKCLKKRLKNATKKESMGKKSLHGNGTILRLNFRILTQGLKFNF